MFFRKKVPEPEPAVIKRIYNDIASIQAKIEILTATIEGNRKRIQSLNMKVWREEIQDPNSTKNEKPFIGLSPFQT